MSSFTRNVKHKGQECSNDDVDRISNLPESVLSQILSFLPTEEAVATSLVSKKWKFLWRNIHNLVFNDGAEQFNRHPTEVGNDLLAHFVNKVLILLNKKSIEKFSLRINEYCEVNNVTTWLEAAVSMNTKVFEFVSWFSDAYFKLPCSLFTCKTLEVLNLRGAINLDVPSLVFLPKLKTLRLELVIYQSDESVCKFILGCPLLETLEVKRNGYDNVVTFSISSPTLRNLNFQFYDEWRSEEVEYEFKLEINAPALRYLRLYDTISKDFYVENLHCVHEAKVALSIDESLVDYDRYSKAVAKLLQGLYNVKNLSLMGDTLKALSHANMFTSYPRLSQLTVKAKCCKWNSLQNLIEASSKLEYLTFSKDHCHEGTHEACWSNPERVPVCLLSCLKTMSIDGFEGLVDELAMVAYILKNAKVLKTMTLEVRYPFDTRDNLQLLRKVSRFPRGSEECELDYDFLDDSP